MQKQNPAEQSIRDYIKHLIETGDADQRLPRVRDLMKQFKTSQRVVQRALEPLILNRTIEARPGAGLKLHRETHAARAYDADCLILYRVSESRLAQTLLIQLVARLRRKGHQIELKGFESEDVAIDYLNGQRRMRCCLLQINFETVSVRFLAKIKEISDALVIDGVSVTGIDADVIGTNWREALSIGYRRLSSQGHKRIGFLTSSHDARQIAMARREYLLLSDWSGNEPHPLLHTMPRLPGQYQLEELVQVLPERGATNSPITALIVWGLVDGYMMNAALRDRGLRAGIDISLLLLGSIDVASEHVSRFDMVGNSDAEKLDMFERVVTSRIEGDTSPANTHYLPIYVSENGSIQLMEATS